MLCIGDAGVWKLDCGASTLHHLLHCDTTLTNDHSVMLWRNIDGNVHHQRLENSTLHSMNSDTLHSIN